MKRRLVSLLLALTMLLSLSGCSAEYGAYQLLPKEFLLGESLDADGNLVVVGDASKQLTIDDIRAMNDGQARMTFSKECMDELIACLNTFEINSASGIGVTAGGEQRFNAELGKDIAFDEYLSK